MKIYILNKVLEYKNNENIIEDLFSKIDNIVSNSNYTFSHLQVDGYEVYKDFYNYFFDNIKNIEEVKVIVKTFNEFSRSIFDTTIDYLKNSIPEIEKLSNEFYKSPNKESWTKLIDLIEGIKWIMDTFTLVDKNNNIGNIVKKHDIWNSYTKNIFSLRELLKEFEEILENKDLVSIADILFYEIIPLFNEMLNKLNELIHTEVNVSDFN